MKRRTFLSASAGGTLALTIPTLSRGAPLHGLRVPDEELTLRDPRVIILAHTALEAARSAGASYADVRMTYKVQRNLISSGLPVESVRPAQTLVELGLSVRALVSGYWGWAATPYLSMQEAPRVGREATRLAQVAAVRGKPRAIEWGTIPITREGSWTTPIRIDPFKVATEELCDWMWTESNYIDDLIRFRGDTDGRSTGYGFTFFKRESVYLSTEGSNLTQTVYKTSGGTTFGYKGKGGLINFPAAQGGWEYVMDTRVRDQVRAELDRIDHAPPPLPIKRNLDMGRYDIVFTAETMASFLDAQLGPATQLDRALGYEANAGGTSYLGPDPMMQLGTQIASPLITVTADRSSPRGLATIKWDDDGVVPEDFTLIKDGVLVDYQTTREQAAWLAPWYQKQGKPVRSHGCAASSDALTYPMQHTPNLTLKPGTAAIGLEDLIAGVKHGLVVDGMSIHMDFQCSNGLGLIGTIYGRIWEVRNGKRVALFDPNYVDRGVQFSAKELWKAVQALGGPASLVTQQPGWSFKGEPLQNNGYSIAAVPALVKQQAVIDPYRKA